MMNQSLPPESGVWDKVMFLHLSVSHSVQGGAGVSTSGGVYLQGLSASTGGRGGLLGRPHRDTLDTMGYGQQTSGRHPTGIHSCYFKHFHPEKNCMIKKKKSTEAGIHPGFETKGRHHQSQKLKNMGISGPTKMTQAP